MCQNWLNAEGLILQDSLGTRVVHLEFPVLPNSSSKLISDLDFLTCFF